MLNTPVRDETEQSEVESPDEADETETTEPTPAETTEPTTSAPSATLDELRADFQRRTREEEEMQRADAVRSVSQLIESVLGRGLVQLLGITTAWSDEHGMAVGRFTVDGEDWRIWRYGATFGLRDGVTLIAPDYPDYAETSVWPNKDAQDNTLKAISQWRERDVKRQEHRQGISAYGVKIAPAVNPEPQVLIDQPGRSRIYVLEAETGCGSISQLSLTVARLDRDGDVELGRLVPDTNDGEYVGVRMVRGPVMGTLMKLITGWQEEIAKTPAPNTPTQAPEDPDLPF